MALSSVLTIVCPENGRSLCEDVSDRDGAPRTAARQVRPASQMSEHGACSQRTDESVLCGHYPQHSTSSGPITIAGASSSPSSSSRNST